MIGKCVIIVYVVVGMFFGLDLDFVLDYLQYMLGFIGIIDVIFVVVDWLVFDCDVGLVCVCVVLDVIVV